MVAIITHLSAAFDTTVHNIPVFQRGLESMVLSLTGLSLTDHPVLSVSNVIKTQIQNYIARTVVKAPKFSHKIRFIPIFRSLHRLEINKCIKH